MRKLITITLIFYSTISFSQKGKILEGNYKNLKGIEVYCLVFDYSDFQVQDNSLEEESLENKVSESDKKEIGLGQEYNEAWFSDRSYKYEPRFIEAFNEYFKKREVKVVKDLKNSEYTMKVHTNTYPGFDIGVSNHEKDIDAIINIYRTDSPSNIIFSIEIKDLVKRPYQDYKTYVRGYELNADERIGFTYWALGKYFAKQLRMRAK